MNVFRPAGRHRAQGRRSQVLLTGALTIGTAGAALGIGAPAHASPADIGSDGAAAQQSTDDTPPLGTLLPTHSGVDAQSQRLLASLEQLTDEDTAQTLRKFIVEGQKVHGVKDLASSPSYLRDVLVDGFLSYYDKALGADMLLYGRTEEGRREIMTNMGVPPALQPVMNYVLSRTPELRQQLRSKNSGLLKSELPNVEDQP
ncbi:hypothetical protein ACFQZ0_00925 [Streptomyces erythrogriseus]|uniref:Uncharacterized protein n=1 Tax=Streptomyces erythrogriseus TaxID=284027 RepID=A0ABN3XE42_9ACTN